MDQAFRRGQAVLGIRNRARTVTAAPGLLGVVLIALIAISTSAVGATAPDAPSAVAAVLGNAQATVS